MTSYDVQHWSCKLCGKEYSRSKKTFDRWPVGSLTSQPWLFNCKHLHHLISESETYVCPEGCIFVHAKEELDEEMVEEVET